MMPWWGWLIAALILLVAIEGFFFCDDLWRKDK